MPTTLTPTTTPADPPGTLAFTGATTVLLVIVALLAIAAGWVAVRWAGDTERGS